MNKRFLSAAVLSVTTALSTAAYADYSLTILHLNDLHSRIESINKYDSTCDAESETEGKCFGGIARIKSKLDERRAALEGEGVPAGPMCCRCCSRRVARPSVSWH